jgi:hypothetical protein
VSEGLAPDFEAPDFEAPDFEALEFDPPLVVTSGLQPAANATTHIPTTNPAYPNTRMAGSDCTARAIAYRKKKRAEPH